MTVLSGICAVVVLAVLQAAPQGGPESFDLIGTLTPKSGASGAITVPMTIQIDRYTPEHARTTMTDALKFNGYPGFLRALREAPQAGSLTVADEVFVIRWARQIPSDTGRTISFVTERPVFFIGSRRKDAKPTAGYELAVVQLTLDKGGRGTGTMAAAARIKPGGETGVRLDSYAETPVPLTVKVR